MAKLTVPTSHLWQAHSNGLDNCGLVAHSKKKGRGDPWPWGGGAGGIPVDGGGLHWGKRL
jgi:hypothetical protein